MSNTNGVFYFKIYLINEGYWKKNIVHSENEIALPYHLNIDYDLDLNKLTYKDREFHPDKEMEKETLPC